MVAIAITTLLEDVEDVDALAIQLFFWGQKQEMCPF